MAAAFRPILLFAMIHGMQAFYLPGLLVPQRQGQLHQPWARQSSRVARLIGRDRSLRDLYAQLDIQAAIGRKSPVTSHDCR